VWANEHWTLYEVIDPTPVVDSPGMLISAQSDRILFDVQQAGNVTLRVHGRCACSPSPDLRRLPSSSSDGTRVVVVGAVPGVYTLTSSFSGRSRWC
jgi:hypothetical protein